MIYTARYVLPGDAPLIDRGALLALEGKIAAVGPLRQLRRHYPDVDIVDFGNALLMPPMVNAHTHLELSHFPRWQDRDSDPAGEEDGFVDWIERVIRVKHAVPQESYFPSLASGIRDSLRAGTALVGDILSQLPARNAYFDSPLRGRLFLETLGQSEAYTAAAWQKIEPVLQRKKVAAMDVGVAPHSPYTLSRSYLARLYDMCAKQQIHCTTHVAESPAEVEFLLSHTGEISTTLYPFVGWEGYLAGPAPGQRPIAYLRDCGGLQPNNLLVHGVQLVSEEIDMIAAAGCSLVLCPRSNERLGVGTAPVSSLQRAGINLALGTDSLASCDSLSIWDEVAFSATTFAGQVDAPTLLHMATRGGAIALGYGSDFGLLAPGRGCSFQVLRPEHLPAPAELHDFLVAPGRTADVVQLVLDGHPVLSDDA